MEEEDFIAKLTPTEFIALCNDTLEYAYQNITIEGEVANFKINQGKWVFFDIKDEESSVGCFTTVYKMRLPLEDGMKIRLRGTPKLTAWGRFSITVRQVTPVGEGSLKKSFELLKEKLTKEGLFRMERKRPLPDSIQNIGVISSTQAAGYADFIKILNERWGGMNVQVAHTQVQGLAAPDQIIRALNYFNERGEVDVIAIIRGGGSADDLSAFNDERLVRAIAASKIPVITGIGHEVDESLADLATDITASTPSNAAQFLTPDRHAEIRAIEGDVSRLHSFILDKIAAHRADLTRQLASIEQSITLQINTTRSHLRSQIQLIDRLNPENVLAQGYALVTGKLAVGSVVKITTDTHLATAKVQTITKKGAKK